MAVACTHECVLTERLITLEGFTVGAFLKSKLPLLMRSALAASRGPSTSSAMGMGTLRLALHRMPHIVLASFRQGMPRCFPLSTSAFFQVSQQRGHANRTATHRCSRALFTESGFAAPSGQHETL